MGPERDRAGQALSRRAEARHFDRVIAEAGDFDPFTSHGWGVLARCFDTQVAGQRFHRLLDVGCGTVRSRQVYAHNLGSYIGIDLSLSALIRGRLKSPGTRLALADACALPFSAECFDGIAFSSVLHHLAEPEAALREAHRVLRPAGWVFAFDPNLLHPPLALFRHPRSPFYRSQGVSPNERPVMPAEVRRWFADAGFLRVEQRCRSGIAYRSVAPPLLDRLLPLYNAADFLLQHLGLGRTFGSFVLTAARKPE